MDVARSGSDNGVMAIVSQSARELRDLERARFEEESMRSLAARYDGKTVRRIEVRDGRAFEVMIYGTYDAPNDPTSGFLLWIFVRPKAVSAIPVVRWLLSARASVVAYE
jgi:hypothetical protein